MGLAVELHHSFTVKTRLLQGSDEHVDGCATFFREDAFTITWSMSVEFNKLAEDLFRRRIISQVGARRSAHVQSQLQRLKRGNVAHLLQMQYYPGPSGAWRVGFPVDMAPTSFFLCNCHLFWDPKFSDVKLVQAFQLLTQIQSVLAMVPMPHILMICGDFNSEPNSAVYEFMSTGQVSMNHPEVLSDPEGIIAALGVKTIHHELNLHSCYKDTMGEEPQYTNYTDHYQGCLDYIWVTSPIIQPMKVSMLPSVPEICSFGDLKLPNPKYPSDHLALDCNMVIDTRQAMRC